MKRVVHVLTLLVLSLTLLCWVPAGLSSAESVPAVDTGYAMIDDYWPMDATGPGRVIYASGQVEHGHVASDGQESWTADVGGDNSWGDDVDRKYIQLFNPGYGVWDLGQDYSEVVLFPIEDHGPYPAEALEFQVLGSNDFDVSRPGQSTWVVAHLDRVYRKGWSAVGEDKYTTCNDDYVSVWHWGDGSSGEVSYRFIKVWSPWDAPFNEGEIDAVRGVLPDGECGGWETGIVDKGRTFSYTSLKVGPGDRVHVAYGGEQLYYAVRDGSTWDVEEVDNGNVGAYCSLALDSLGRPSISYYDAGNGDLKYAYKNGTLNDVWGTSASNIYGVGDGGTIVHYDGSAWRQMKSGTTQDLYGIGGSSGASIFAVGDGGTVLLFDGVDHNADGSLWDPLASGTGQTLRSVWGLTGTSVFAAGYGGTILYYDGVDHNADGSLWDPLASGTSNDLYGVWGTSATNVFAVGEAGTIRRYNTPTWTAMNSNTSEQLSAVWGSSDSDVYAVGYGGVIRRYAGSGVNWSPVSSTVTDCLGDVWGTSASDVFAVGCRGTVLHFGGSSWSRMISGTTNRLDGVWGSSAGNVVAVGDDGALIRYDGTIWTGIASGDGWLTETVDSQNNVGQHTSLAFIGGSPAISYYDATNAKLKYAICSPATGTWVTETVHDPDWESQDWVGQYTSLAPDDFGRPAISYYDASNEDLMFAAWDGVCWQIQRIDTAGDVGRYSSLAYDHSGYPAVSYHDATAGSLKYAHWNGSSWQIETVDHEGWVGQHTSLGFDAANRPCISYYDAVGQDLKFAHWTGMGWDVAVVDSEGVVGSHTSVDFDSFDRVVVSYYDATNEAVKVASRDSDTPLAGVWGDGSTVVFAVGDYGAIRQYRGDGWAPMSSGTAVSLNGVWGTSSTNVYAVGDGGTILHYNGTTWATMSGGTTTNLLGIWGRSASEIYAVGEGGTILRFDGFSWSTMSVPAGMTRTLAAVWGAPSSSDVIAVGESGTILRYSGSTWVAVPGGSGTTQWLSAVWGNSSTSIFAVGDRGTILYYDGIDNSKDGSLWDPMTSGTTRALSGVWGSSYNDVIAVGEMGAILRFNGSTWSAVSGSLTGDWLRGVWGSSEADVFAVGDGGTILTYGGSAWSVMSTGDWKTETVDPYPWSGRFSSLGFDRDNQAAISFYDGREGDLKYGHWDKDHWVVDTVDSYGDVGRYTSLAFDRLGNPWISYYDSSQGNLKFARWTTGGWVVNPVDNTADDVGSYSSLAFDNAGNAGISYYDATNQCLRYTYWNGTGWDASVKPDATANDTGRYSSLAFDSTGNPAISYYDVTSRQLKCARRIAGVWSVYVVDTVGDWIEGEQAGGYCSLKFDCLDYPSISYFDATNGDLRYASWSGTGWEVQVVDSEGRVGMYTSLEFDSSKRPAISYHDATKGTLKLARWNGKEWSQETIDALQAAGHLTSLEFDRCGSPAISYDSPITGDLKYASPANPKPDQPVNKSPAHGATYVDLMATLECEPFSDPCGDPHRASQWMITAENCEINCSPVFNSGVDVTNLVKIEVPAGALEPVTTYYWCVRHQDCRGAWSPYSEKTAFTTASPPERPVNVSPVAGATSVSLTPALESSAFSDPESGDRHVASQWQITAISDNYSSALLDKRVERTNLTQLEIADGVLANRTPYYWRVRYQDNHGTWSEYSVQTVFTTNSAPDTPVNEQPLNGRGKAGLTPTLRSSAFVDADAGETHLASQWRVTKRVEEQSVGVFDSGVDTSNLTELKTPHGTLEHETTYYWQVRYQDSQGSWSSWSAETNFGTGAPPTVPAALLVAAAAVAVVAVVAMTAPLVVPL